MSSLLTLMAYYSPWTTTTIYPLPKPLNELSNSLQVQNHKPQHLHFPCLCNHKWGRAQKAGRPQEKMATNSTFQLFSPSSAASGFFDSSTEPPLPPPPPPVEVLSSEVSPIYPQVHPSIHQYINTYWLTWVWFLQVSLNVKCSVESVNLEDGLTLLKVSFFALVVKLLLFFEACLLLGVLDREWKFGFWFD